MKPCSDSYQYEYRENDNETLIWTSDSYQNAYLENDRNWNPVLKPINIHGEYDGNLFWFIAKWVPGEYDGTLFWFISKWVHREWSWNPFLKRIKMSTRRMRSIPVLIHINVSTMSIKMKPFSDLYLHIWIHEECYRTLSWFLSLWVPGKLRWNTALIAYHENLSDGD